MNEIRGDAKTVRQLLSGMKYSVDYYQREYKWKTKQVSELLDDLTAKFFDSYEEDHPRTAVADYGHYFLGSIIISDKQGKKFVIDGQQRLTTLTLLLIYLQNLQRDRKDEVQVSELILSEKYGSRSYNLDVADRAECMDALYTGQEFDSATQQESIVNMAGRYSDIQELFPNDLKERALPYFIDWLIENVHLVEITAYSDEDAYTIFETMNDRGLSLSATDMLKGYLLANIGDEVDRVTAGRVWKDRMSELREVGKEEDADFLKSWLRSQYANSIRERKRGARPQDFDRIGTEFHRWTREPHDQPRLKASSDFVHFIRKDMDFYARQYIRLRKAATQITNGLETVFYNAQNNFTLQYPVCLAPLSLKDSEEEILEKVRAAATYIDILIARRIWNFRAIDYSTMQYAMFLVMREIRGMPVTELVQRLREKLDSDSESFSANSRFYLHGQNRRQIHRLIARMTAYVEEQSGMSSHYSEYVGGSGKKAYEVEHIWANKFDEHEDEFAHENDFGEYRNRIGGLLLLPKSFNASFGDLPYSEKLEHYNGQNVLARSLHEKCYDHNPGFLRFCETRGLPFKPHNKFKKADLDARQELYGMLAQQIWNPGHLQAEVGE